MTSVAWKQPTAMVLMKQRVIRKSLMQQMASQQVMK
jgi:hypothetical protein